VQGVAQQLGCQRRPVAEQQQQRFMRLRSHRRHGYAVDATGTMDAAYACAASMRVAPLASLRALEDVDRRLAGSAKAAKVPLAARPGGAW
jgi:hypothetical protein